MQIMGRLGALAILTLPIHVLTALLLLGVPKPPQISTEGVDRVPWSLLLYDADRLWKAQQSKALVGWMPDGSAALVQARRWLLASRLYRLDEPGGKPRLVRAIPRNAHGLYGEPGRPYMIVSWDTDGDEQHRLHRWDLGDGAPVPLTPTPERAAFGAFEPGGPRMAYTSTRRNGRDFDVYVMDPTDPSSDRIVLEVEGTWGVMGWSPTTPELLLGHAVSNMASELFVMHLPSGELRPISAPDERGVRHAAVQWSRDGSYLLYASDRGTEFMHLRRWDFEGEGETVLTASIPWDVTSVQQSRDGATLLIGVNEDGRVRYSLMDADGSDLRALDLFEDGTFSVSLHPTELLAAVNHVDPTGVTRGYMYDLNTDELTLWAGSEPTAQASPEPRLVRYETFDAVDGAPRLISAFVYPGEGDGPQPVVIDIHGGPEAQALLKTGPHTMYSDGITRIAPNVRGSTGYGRTFTTLDDWFLRENAVKDIGALLDWIAEQPDLDADRVAVMGGSYGGYMVLASLVHFSDRIRCGVDVVGVSNFVTFLENTAEYRRDLRRPEYGDERIPEVRAFLEDIAPLNNAERIRSPLMVVQGANDPRVPVGESRQIVERVRGNGLDVAYMEASNEGHGFRQPWNALYAGLAQRQMLRGCLLGG